MLISFWGFAGSWKGVVVAVKVVEHGPEAQELLDREATLATSISHPNLVSACMHSRLTLHYLHHFRTHPFFCLGGVCLYSPPCLGKPFACLVTSWEKRTRRYVVYLSVCWHVYLCSICLCQVPKELGYKLKPFCLLMLRCPVQILVEAPSLCGGLR